LNRSHHIFQEIPPAGLRVLAVRDRSDADAFLQGHNLAYAFGLRAFEILFWYLSDRVILSGLQQAVGTGEAANMLGAGFGSAIIALPVQIRNADAMTFLRAQLIILPGACV
jgi:hypothetical protein